MHVQGFTENVAYFMALSDFLIGKPGPGGISEALAMRLPVIVNNSWTTMVHERFNVRWIEEQGVGMAIKRIQDLPRAIEQLLEPANYSAMRRRIDALNNRAVFEIPSVLEQILGARSISTLP
jgi:1,2-diacylglycerol 3-beta-galactosyltransferase